MMGSHTGWFGCGGICPGALEEVCAPWACSGAGRESGPSQPLLNYGWRGKGGGVDQDSWEKRSTHSDTHTEAVVWGQACCEGGCGWVELFACVSFWCGCLRGLLLERGELGIYQTTSLSRSLPSSASMRPRCDESEYSLWCIIITAQFCLFICWICFLISHRSTDHLRHCDLKNNKNSHWAVT